MAANEASSPARLTPCLHGSLAGHLAESDDATRAALVSGDERWCNLLEGALVAMCDRAGRDRLGCEP